MSTTILPYQNPKAACEWLRRAFDFQVHEVSEDDDGDVRFVSMKAGEAVFLLCPSKGSAFDALLSQPSDLTEVGTHSCYLVVDELDRHCAAARAAGAKIELEPEIDDEGSRYYMCRDPEGHLWSFGTKSFEDKLASNAHANGSQKIAKFSLAAVAVGIVLVPGTWFVIANANLDGVHNANRNERSRQFALLTRQIKHERARRMLAERRMTFATQRLAKAKNTRSILEQQLKKAESAIQHARLARETTAQHLHSVQADFAQRLDNRESRITELEQSKSDAVAAVAKAGQKLAHASNENAALKQQLKEVDAALIKSRGDIEKVSDALHAAEKRSLAQRKRFAFVSREFRRVSGLILVERQRSKDISHKLLESIDRLTKASAEAAGYNEKISLMEQELRAMRDKLGRERNTRKRSKPFALSLPQKKSAKQSSTPNRKLRQTTLKSVSKPKNWSFKVKFNCENYPVSCGDDKAK